MLPDNYRINQKIENWIRAAFEAGREQTVLK